MKTNELIDMLGTNLEPVKGGKLRNTLMIALAVGALSASCLMLVASRGSRGSSPQRLLPSS